LKTEVQDIALINIAKQAKFAFMALLSLDKLLDIQNPKEREERLAKSGIFSGNI